MTHALLTNVPVDPLLLCGYFHAAILDKVPFLKTEYYPSVFDASHNFG